MKLEVGKNEAYIKLSVDQDSGIQFSYGFNVDSLVLLKEQLDSGKISEAQHEAIMDVIYFISGIASSIKNCPDEVLGMGETAIEVGDFDIDVLSTYGTTGFIESLTEDQIELLTAPTKGIQ